jgi:hypothetical protein
MNETNAHHAETKRPADEPARRAKQVYGAVESRRGRLPIGRASGCGVGRGGKIPGGALAGRLLEAELTQKPDAFSCCQGHENDQIEDERTRRGGRADETGGLVGGRGGVRTGKAQPPRGGASRGRAANDRLFFF